MNDTLWTNLGEILKQRGPITFVLLFGFYLFWKLIWKVWSAAMKSKDDEINRLVQECDRYQNLVFERLLSSQPPKRPEKGENE